MPILVFGGTAAEYGTVDSATLIVESDYFNAVNLKIVNSAPRPDGKRVGAQAATLRIDTLCDDKGKHFYKDCHIEGTVDFVFGCGKSLYLNTELHVILGDTQAVITAQARTTDSEDTGYSFVHCKVTGTSKGGVAYLGRSWMPAAKVLFAYTEMSDVVIPEGWSILKPEHASTVRFAEYNNKGIGANMDKRVSFVAKLTDADAKPFSSLAYLDASKWLLPPAKV
ncbi:putative pectinesterase 63 [Abeliophyllum distichum]|uniref:Pectinesterase n=1 Tax=Abeliophyllum distichum TaxID=126358 RepID=A0ABD1UPI5_9LAMI